MSSTNLPVHFSMTGNLTNASAQMSQSVLGTLGKMGDGLTQLSGPAQNLSGTQKKLLGVVNVSKVLTGVYSAAVAPIAKLEGELTTLGVSKLGVESITQAGQKMALQYGKITAPQFIKASTTIKKNLSGLSDNSVKEFTHLAALTSQATDSSIDAMSLLLTKGYQLFNQDFTSDTQFGQQFSAAITATSKQFNISGADLSQGLNQIGSAAKNMGISTTEGLSVIGVAAKEFGSANAAGKKYQAFLEGAKHSTNKLEGVNFTNSAGKMLPMIAIIDQLKQKFGDTIDESEKLQLDKALGGSGAADILLSMIGKTDQLSNAQQHLAKHMANGTSNLEALANAANKGQAFARLGNAFSLVGYHIGNTFEPVMNLAKGMVWLDASFPKLLPSIGSLSKRLGQVKSGLLGARTSLLGFSQLLRTTTVMQWGLNAALYANPIGLVVGALAVAGTIIYKYWQPLKAFFSGFFDGFSSAMQPVFSAFQPLLNLFAPIGTVLQWVASQIGHVVSWFGALLSPVQSSEEELTNFATKGAKLGEIIGKVFSFALTPITLVAKGLGWVGEKLGLLGGKEDASFISHAKSPSPTSTFDSTSNQAQSDQMVPNPLAQYDRNAPIKQSSNKRVTQHINMNVTVNNPASGIDIERSIAKGALRAAAGSNSPSLTDEDI